MRVGTLVIIVILCFCLSTSAYHLKEKRIMGEHSSIISSLHKTEPYWDTQTGFFSTKERTIYTLHEPIHINDNSQFTEENGVTSGFGTLEDPYIIENWEIDISAGTNKGIVIRTTNVHFIIRNCYIHGSLRHPIEGIFLCRVANGSIIDTVVEKCSYGISLYKVTNSRIITTTAKNCREGTKMYESSNNRVLNSSFRNNIEGVLNGFSNSNIIMNCKFVENNAGISIDGTSLENKIINCEYYNNGAGISTFGSADNEIINCTFSNNSEGIDFQGAERYILRNNTLINNEMNFGVFGFFLSTYTHDIDKSNTIDGKPVYYLINHSDLTLNGKTMNIGYIGLVSCDNITVKNLKISNNGEGLLLANTSNSIIVHSSFFNNAFDGIMLFEANNNKITNCMFYTNEIGAQFYHSSNNHLADSTFYNNSGCGVYFYMDASNNTVLNNTLYKNGWGIDIMYYSNNNNSIYHNNFINNTNQAWDCCSNCWDDGYPSGGNYWSDYTGTDLYCGEKQNIPGCDGIGDTPYNNIYNFVGDNNSDNYPLINPTTPLNHPPNIGYWQPSFDTVINETESIKFNITASDIDDNNLSYSWYIDDALRPEEINDSYIFTTHYDSAGTHEVKVIVTDDGCPSLSVNHIWNLTVLNKNRAPTLEFAEPQTAYEGQTFNLQANATDPDNDRLTFSDDSTLFDINSTTGLISFTPSYDSAGIYLMNISVRDNETIVWQKFQLTILNVNRPPAAIISSPAQNAKFTAEDYIYFDATCSYDLDKDNLSYVWNSSIDGLLSTNKSFSKRLSSGTHTIVLIVSDGQEVETKQITIIVEKLPEKKEWLTPVSGSIIIAVVCSIVALILILRRLKWI